MFISIPKDFFVPVVFGEGFVLNEENNNFELDTGLYRESTKVKGEKQKMEPSKEISKESKVDKKISEVKENATSKAIYIALKSDGDKCKVNNNIFSEADDEYVNGIEAKEGCNK